MSFKFGVLYYGDGESVTPNFQCIDPPNIIEFPRFLSGFLSYQFQFLSNSHERDGNKQKHF
jgi:hypothetical protein